MLVEQSGLISFSKGYNEMTKIILLHKKKIVKVQQLKLLNKYIFFKKHMFKMYWKQ